jgi:bifunctional DNA-binding transcriptional regulator/antitoxin component of YhaV-PrlF toxin-antitoxin module
MNLPGKASAPMESNGRTARRKQTYRAKVTGRHAITLPAELCRTIEIAVGDVIEVTVEGEQATLAKAASEAIPPARGLLRGYFPDWESVNRSVEEERRGWAEREAELMNTLYPPQPPADTSPG